MSPSVKELQQEGVSPAAYYISTSASVLFLFESVITIGEELDAVWNRKWTSTTWLYTFTRYSVLMDSIIKLLPIGNLVQYDPPSLCAYPCQEYHFFNRCKAILYADDVLILISFLCFALFSALRVHALLNGKHIIAISVFVFSAMPFATNLYNFITGVIIDNSGTCREFLNGSGNVTLALSLTTRLAVIVGDVLVLAVTWMKTAQWYRNAKRVGIYHPLATVLFRDGTIYFVILLIINTLQVLQNNVPILFSLDYADSFFIVLQYIILCRFILNLRQVPPAGSSRVSGSNKSISFRFVGNAGQTLSFGSDDMDSEGMDGLEQTTDVDDCGLRPLGDVDVSDDDGILRGERWLDVAGNGEA